MSVRLPKYRHHKTRGLAVVTLAGKDHYLSVVDRTAEGARHEPGQHLSGIGDFVRLAKF